MYVYVVCVYVRIYIYIYIYTYVYICIFLSLSIYIYIYMYMNEAKELAEAPCSPTAARESAAIEEYFRKQAERLTIYMYTFI